MKDQSATSTVFRELVFKLQSACPIPDSNITFLLKFADSIHASDIEERYSKPMLWIGLYIALASLVCILAMVADLVHGLRRRRLWFPCKYFTINAASLTVISIAMKLPVDLSGSMFGVVDQATKLGSMAFMGTMMANLLPWLATMDNNELLSNIVALCVLVITLVVNVCIQIQTGVVDGEETDVLQVIAAPGLTANNTILAIIYMTLLLVLLIFHVSSSLAILKSKQIIESKYQIHHDTTSEDIQQSLGVLTVENLQKHVCNHWIMASSGSPQFITACSPTTSASGVICAIIALLHILTLIGSHHLIVNMDYASDYKWSMMVILIVQSIGVVVGTIAPVSRCFASLSFKVSLKVILNHLKVFKVESYWTWKLYDWKHGSIHEFRSRNLEMAIETLKRLIISICIGFQKGVVVVCKVIALIPFLFMICVLSCFGCMKRLLKVVFSSLGKKIEKIEQNNDLRPYVLQLEDEIELAERTLESLSKSVKQLIQKGAKTQPKNLIKLIEQKSTSGFQGVKKFDNIDHDVSPKVEYQDCWRLHVVTLTTLAMALPKIEKEEVDSLLESVREGLIYVVDVERSLNATGDLANSQKAAETLWREMKFDKKWLGTELQGSPSQVKTAQQIVESFMDIAKDMAFTEERCKNYIGGPNDDPVSRSICANSMYRITKTILLTNHTNNDDTVSQKELFNSLSSMIADIMAACLTNLPQVIIMKCHTSEIEKREAGVKDAAQLLGESTRIIEILQNRDIPGMNPSDLSFIEKWHTYLWNP